MDPIAVFLAARTTARSLDELTGVSRASTHPRREDGWSQLGHLDRYRYRH